MEEIIISFQVVKEVRGKKKKMVANFSFDFCVFGSTDVGDDNTKQDVVRGDRVAEKKKDDLNNSKDGKFDEKRKPMKIL